MPVAARSRRFGGMFVLHFVLAGALAYGAAMHSSAGWAYGALLVFCSMCLGLLRFAPATFLLLVPLLALRVTEFISGAAIESGAYMIETRIYGRATGAFTHLLLIYLCFFLVATIVVEAVWPRLRSVIRDAPRRWEEQAALIWTGLLIFIVVSTAYLVRLGINNGFPLINGFDRYAYLERIDSPLYRSFITNRLVFVPFVGVLIAIARYRTRGVFALVWLLATSIMFGEKFGSLLMILSVVAIPPGLVHIANDRLIPVRAIAGIAAAIVTVTVPAVLIAYGGLSDFDKAVKLYGNRVALQGQLWYLADDRYLAVVRLDDRALAADTSTWLHPGEQSSTRVGARFGLYYVMQRFAPSRILGWFMEGGNGFVFSLYPYLLIAYGIVGVLIVSSLIAIYHAFLMTLLAMALARSSWLAGFAFARIMSSVYGMYAQGFLWNIVGIKTLLTFAAGVLILWETGRRGSVLRRATGKLASRVAPA